MSASTEEDRCQACAAYLAHYPMMADEWDCDHGADEQAFMLAMADAIHGPTPVGEFTDPGWRAAQFLDEAEVALSCGHAPYTIQITRNVEPWTFMALVNRQHLIGTRNDEGAELEHIADVGWLAAKVRGDTLEEAAKLIEACVGCSTEPLQECAKDGDEAAQFFAGMHAQQIRALANPEIGAPHGIDH